jgi:hypothetical protein
MKDGECDVVTDNYPDAYRKEFMRPYDFCFKVCYFLSSSVMVKPEDIYSAPPSVENVLVYGAQMFGNHFSDAFTCKVKIQTTGFSMGRISLGNETYEYKADAKRSFKQEVVVNREQLGHFLRIIPSGEEKVRVSVTLKGNGILTAPPKWNFFGKHSRAALAPKEAPTWINNGDREHSLIGSKITEIGGGNVIAEMWVMNEDKVPIRPLSLPAYESNDHYIVVMGLHVIAKGNIENMSHRCILSTWGYNIAKKAWTARRGLNELYTSYGIEAQNAQVPNSAPILLYNIFSSKLKVKESIVMSRHDHGLQVHEEK